MDLREAIAIIAGSMDESSLSIEDYLRYGFSGKVEWSHVKKSAEIVLYEVITKRISPSKDYRSILTEMIERK